MARNIGEFFANGNVILLETECGPRAVGQIFRHYGGECTIQSTEDQDQMASRVALAACCFDDMVNCLRTVWDNRNAITAATKGVDVQRCRIMLEKAGVQLPHSNW